MSSSECFGIGVPLEPPQDRIGAHEAKLAGKVHDRLSQVAGGFRKDTIATPAERLYNPKAAKIIIVNFTPRHPLEEPAFNDLPNGLRAFARQSHLGATEDAPITYPNKLTWATGLELNDPEIVVWDLANEDPDNPQFDDLWLLAQECDGAFGTGSPLMLPKLIAQGSTSIEMRRIERFKQFLEAWTTIQRTKEKSGLPVSPFVGTCYAHQLIAYLMGDEQTVGPAPKPESGPTTVEINKEGRRHVLLKKLGKAALWVESRTLGVQKLPPDAVVLGCTAVDRHSILRYKSIPGLVTLSGHTDLWAQNSLEPMRRIRGLPPNSLDLDGYDPEELARTKLGLYGQFLKEVARSFGNRALLNHYYSPWWKEEPYFENRIAELKEAIRARRRTIVESSLLASAPLFMILGQCVANLIIHH